MSGDATDTFVVPTHRHAASGSPVLATQLPGDDDDVIGGPAVAAGWLCRWVDAIGGAATSDGVNVHVGDLAVSPGQWLVYDFRSLTVLDHDAFQHDYVTDLHARPSNP